MNPVTSILRAILLSGYFFIVGHVSFAQDVNMVLQRHFNAIGQENLKNIRTVSAMVTEVGGFGEGQKYELIKKQPDKIRKEGTDKGEKFITAFDGDSAWLWTPNSDTAFRWLDQRNENILHLESIIGSPLILGQKEGFYLEVIGSAYLEKRAAYKLRLTFPDGFIADFLIDKKDFYLKKLITYTNNDTENIEMEVLYSNFRNLGSFVFPYKLTRKFGSDPAIDVIIGEIAVGVGAANDIFSPPK